MATPEQWQALREGIVEALHSQDSYEVAVAAATALDAGRYRVVSTFDLDENDRPDPLSCYCRVEVWHNGEWQGLYKAHWTALHLTLDDVFDMAEDVVAQHEMGVYPDGPYDLGA
jgi:hypothetical protein